MFTKITEITLYRERKSFLKIYTFNITNFVKPIKTYMCHYDTLINTSALKIDEVLLFAKVFAKLSFSLLLVDYLNDVIT